MTGPTPGAYGMGCATEVNGMKLENHQERNHDPERVELASTIWSD